MLVEQIRLFILDVQSPCMVPRTGEWCGVSRFVPDGKWDWNYTHHRVPLGTRPDGDCSKFEAWVRLKSGFNVTCGIWIACNVAMSGCEID